MHRVVLAWVLVAACQGTEEDAGEGTTTTHAGDPSSDAATSVGDASTSVTSP
jgi:hypothetical protein